MDELIDFIRIMGGIIFGVFLFLYIVIFCCYEYTINIGEANLIKITMDDKVIYKGKAAFVTCNSGGMTTTINIYKSLFPFGVLDRSYSSNNIKVVPLEN